MPNVDLPAQEHVAIIGMACRFPGAKTIDAFWRNLRDGVESITFFSAQELAASGIDPAIVQNPDHVPAGPILDDVEYFDAAFFDFSPRQAELTDPQQRLFLECAWEALESAGYDPATYERLIGVFAGSSLSSYLLFNVYPALGYAGVVANLQTLIGIDKDYLATHTSYKLNLRGPSVNIQTACSTSLVSVHLACQSLLDGECDMALAGGVTVRVPQKAGYLYQQGGILTPDGHCRPFDAGAQGTLFGSGAGVVVLKRLSDAIEDGDRIEAIVKGSAINNDGAAKVGYTAPGEDGQAAVIAEALAMAGVKPETISYIEAHGTGTPLGDPIEISALTRVFRASSAAKGICAIGAVKSNVGHLESAAGIAGLIKTVLALKHRQLPPSLHFEQPNAQIDFASSPFYVSARLAEWQAGQTPRRAGVSSFGIGGTNAHIILEEAPQLQAAAQPQAGVYVLPVSGRGCAALYDAIRAYRAFLSDTEAAAALPLSDICYTASLRRRHYSHRHAVVGHTHGELVERLDALLQTAPDAAEADTSTPAPAPNRRRVVFVFPGQGSQWLGMGRQLLAEEPVFRTVIERCDRAMRPYIRWSLIEELIAGEEQARLQRIDVIQPILFAIEVALATLWRSWGIEPDTVIGHSLGEIAAAHIAGALSLEHAAQIICRRSALLRHVSGRGAMALVGLALEQAQRLLEGYEDRLSVAISNSPKSTVLSGDTEALREVMESLERQGVFCRWIKVDVASHSPQMDPLRAELLAALHGLAPRANSIAMISTVTGEAIEGTRLDATYWVRNLREPVLFSRVVQQLRGQEHDIFVEISPHPILLPAIEDCLYHLDQPGAVLPSLRRDTEERKALFESLGALYHLGQPVNWGSIYREPGRCVRLPSYPWQRQRYWLEPGKGARLGQGIAVGTGAGAAAHPILGRRLRTALKDSLFEACWDFDTLPYLQDHQVCGRVIIPATVYLEAALAALREIHGPGAHTLVDLTVSEPLFLEGQAGPTIQTILTPGDANGGMCQIFSQDADQETWRLHASGHYYAAEAAALAPDSTHTSEPPAQAITLAAAQERCRTEMPGTAYYDILRERGLEYGPGFQGLTTVWRGAGEALGLVQLPEALVPRAAEYSVHPAMLDACFQLFGATFADETDQHLYIPINVGRLCVRAAPGARVWSYAVLRASDQAQGEALTGDIYLFDQDGKLVAEVEGLRVRRTSRAALRHAGAERVSDWLYELDWQPRARSTQPRQIKQTGRWLIFADRQGVGVELAQLLADRGATCELILAGDAYQAVEPGCYSIDAARPEDFERLLAEGQAPCRGIIHLWGLDAAPGERTSADLLRRDQERICGSVLHIVQAIVKAAWQGPTRLWLLTSGAQPVEPEDSPLAPAQASLWGLGRVIALEHPDLRCCRIDMAAGGDQAQLHELLEEICAGDAEDQIAFRHGTRFVPRLMHSGKTQAAGSRLHTPEHQPFRLAIPQRGLFDNLVLEPVARRAPARGEIEMRVLATGLNFHDVLFASGIDLHDAMSAVSLYPGETGALGLECAGRVVALGEGVQGFQIGEPVVAFAAGAFRTFATIPCDFVARLPEPLTLEDGATIAVTFLTAYYSLHKLAKIAAGDRVLIHAAAGGVGLAAVQLAQQAGADVFATAGSPEKRELLRSLGVRQIMNSRSLDFAAEIMERTGGRGVDVVLNSLSGEFIPKSLAVLGANGRFVEIGRRAIWSPKQVAQARPDVFYTIFDLGQQGLDQPAEVGSLLRGLMEDFARGTLRPLPRRVFPIEDAISAFRTMAQGKHSGKIVVTQADQLPAAAPEHFRTDATYLITGGLGDLGLLVAGWMVDRGARHLALVGRSGASEAAQAAIRTIEQAGAEARVLRADVSCADDVARVLADVAESMPPLRGIVHAAGVLDDGVLLKQQWDRFAAVFAPKVQGAWNLHTATSHLALDFFILFSSTAALLGTPGQGNYAAANAFMDALAHDRRSHGLPALSINWGGWSEIGLAARHNVGDRMTAQGIGAIDPQQGLRVLDQLLHSNLPQVAVLPVNWSRLLEQFGVGGAPPILAELAREARARGKGQQPNRAHSELIRRLEEAPAHNRRRVLLMYMREQIGKVLGLASSFKLDPQQPLNQLGLDSLMAIELRNALGYALGRTLPATLLFDYPTLDSLAAYLAREVLQLPADEHERHLDAPRADVAEADAELRDIQQFSADDLEALLAEELAAVKSLTDVE